MLDDDFHADLSRDSRMIVTNFQLQHQNWTFLGEGKVHIIFRYVEPDTNTSIANTCIDTGLPTNISQNAGADGNFVVANASESDVTTSIEHRVLRLTKKKCSVDDILRDELYLNHVIKPWLSDSYCSERVLVSLSGAFLEGLKTYCYDETSGTFEAEDKTAS